MSPLGHRRKILRAIAELTTRPLRGSHGTATRRRPPSAAPPPAATAEAGGERRYLTVMFCDLVGSTGIAAQLDAEEWRDLVGPYLDDASAAVTGMGGHVAKKLGDGILALFGYPVAHENDAERAARAALAIQRALADLNRRNAGTEEPELTARIGLDTGPAVVDAAGEIYGDVATLPPASRRSRSRAPSSSRRAYSVRSRDCSSPKTVASMRSRACPRRRCCSGSSARAAAAAVPDSASSRRSSAATTR